MRQRQIEAFRLVMLRGTMTAAAEELRTSQPSVSRLINELEESTGLALFSRNGGRLQATEAGTAFYREVELSFLGLEHLRQIAREIYQVGSGRLRITAAPVLALSILPAIIARFKQTFPDVMVSLEMRSEPTILRWTSSGYCDLGFATAPPDAIGVVIEQLYSVPGICVLPAGHRLLRKKQVQASDFAGESLVLPSYAVATRAALDRALGQAGVNQVPSVETPYGATICALVAEGAGIGIVNPLALLHAPPGLASRAFSPDIRFDGYAVYPESHRANPLIHAFNELTRAYIQTALQKHSRKLARDRAR